MGFAAFSSVAQVTAKRLHTMVVVGSDCHMIDHDGEGDARSFNRLTVPAE